MAEPIRAEPVTREVRIGQVLNEYLDRKARGEPITPGQVFAAHPDLTAELRTHFELLGELHAARDSVSGLLAQGILARSADPRYPAELGSYKVLGLLGRGGMGVVLKAYEESLNRTVALKILRPELGDDAVALQRFTHEAKAAAALQHPNIVTIHTVGQEGGTHYLAMEYVDGPTLAEVIRENGPLPAEAARHLFAQLLDALVAAHAAGLIHRDIKSANLLLDKSPWPWPGGPSSGAATGRSPSATEQDVRPGDRTLQSTVGCDPAGATRPGSVPSAPQPLKPLNPRILKPSTPSLKLADFGLARMLTAQTRLTIAATPFGTPEYMSPEQARGGEDVDHRSDLYSAGVVLYEMLTGRTPFRADTPTAVLHHVLHAEPTDPRRLNKSADAALSTLALRLMAKRREDRFGSAQQVLAALETGWRVRLPEKRRRFRRRVIAMTLILPCLAALLWLGRSQGSSQPNAASGGAVRSIAKARGEAEKIKVMYEGESEWKDFHTFAYLAEGSTSAVLATEASGRKIIVAGTNEVIDGECVFAFNEDGSALWNTHIPSSVSWPDLQGEPLWISSVELAADLDGHPGDEVLVYQHDRYEYASCLAILDPSSATVRGVLWHTGQLNQIWLEPRYIDGQRPGIVVCGYNNKLDGFRVPQDGDALPLTPYDKVTIAMIVDPQQMLRDGEGIAPPHAPRQIALPPLKPLAYAFLDMAPSANELPSPGDDPQRSPQQPDEIASINGIGRSGVSDAESTVLLDVTIVQPGNDGCHLIVDSGLAVQRVIESSVATSKKDDPGYWDRFWRSRWRVLIREGKYLAQPSQAEAARR